MFKITVVLASYTAFAFGSGVEYRATLFGNPCTLKGPSKIGEAGLKMIHQMGPERIPLPTQLEETKRHLASLKKQTQTPVGLDRYKDLLIKRLSAQQAFYEGLAMAKKNRKIDALLQAVKPFQNADRAKRFETQLAKMEKEKGAQFWTLLSKNEFQDDVTLVFADSVDPMPEEEFHKALTKMGVAYDCTFEAQATEAEEEEELED
ncbi:MAG: hypothetical protein JNL01_09415 [Bdellovibrionales bacterium]|nr:hypothetical protein [Bdellovibrionales bacterium]